MPSRHLRATAAFAFLALAGIAVPAAADMEHVTRTLKISPGGTLRLNGFSGKVIITGSDRSEVSIDATRYGTRDQLEHVKLEIDSDGTNVRIHTNQHDRAWWLHWGHWGGWGRAVETDLDIKVPRQINLDINLFSASLHVAGIEGSHTIETFSSRASLEDVVGPIRAKSFSGPFEIRTGAWQDKQIVDVDTFSGSVDLHLPDSARGTVEFDSFSGRLQSAMPLTFQSSRRKHIVGQLGDGNGGGRVRVKSFSGNLTIDR